jgi:hypothetical protein
MRLDRGGHARSRFAGTDDHDAAGGQRREVRRHAT